MHNRRFARARVRWCARRRVIPGMVQLCAHMLCPLCALSISVWPKHGNDVASGHVPSSMSTMPKSSHHPRCTTHTHIHMSTRRRRCRSAGSTISIYSTLQSAYRTFVLLLDAYMISRGGSRLQNTEARHRVLGNNIAP